MRVLCNYASGPRTHWTRRPTILKRAAGDHTLLTNFSSSNKSRSVALIIHNSWSVLEIFKDSTGSLVGARIARKGYRILLVSAYLPTSLDNYGAPLCWDPELDSPSSRIQEETHSIYATLSMWIANETNWAVGGDLNETRSPIDRIRKREIKERPVKFIEQFLAECNGTDVWRTPSPQTTKLHIPKR